MRSLWEWPSSWPSGRSAPSSPSSRATRSCPAGELPTIFVSNELYFCGVLFQTSGSKIPSFYIQKQKPKQIFYVIYCPWRDFPPLCLWNYANQFVFNLCICSMIRYKCINDTMIIYWANISWFFVFFSPHRRFCVFNTIGSMIAFQWNSIAAGRYGSKAMSIKKTNLTFSRQWNACLRWSLSLHAISSLTEERFFIWIRETFDSPAANGPRGSPPQERGAEGTGRP